MGNSNAAQHNAAQQGKPTPQVQSEMSRMDSDIGRLEAATERLGQMLTGVLRSEPPLAGAEATPINEGLVPHADSLRNFRTRISMVSNQIDSIMGRLEV